LITEVTAWQSRNQRIGFATKEPESPPLGGTKIAKLKVLRMEE